MENQEATRDEPHNQRVNLWNGVLKAISIRLVNPYLGINIVRLGAPNLFLGMMVAVPFLAQGLAALVGLTGWAPQLDRPRGGTWWFLGARLGVLALAVIDGTGGSALAFLVVVVVINLPAAVGTIAWQTLLSRVLSPAGRAAAVLRRQWAMNAVGLLVLLGGGWVMGNAPGVQAYARLDGVAALVGVAEVAVYRRFRAGSAADPPRRSWGEVGGRLAALPAYRRFVGAAATFYVGWLLLWPVSLRYQVSVVQATNAWMAAWVAASTVATMIGLPVWQRCQRRLAVAQLLPVAAGLMMAVPIGYALAPSRMAIVGWSAMGGLAGAGFNWLVFVRLLEVVPAADRVAAVSLYGVATNLAGGAGALLAVAGMGPLGISGVALVSAGLRGLGAGLLARASGSWPRGAARQPVASSLLGLRP